MVPPLRACSSRRRCSAPGSPPEARWRAVAAGALILAGALFREETLPALPALLIARALSLPARSARALVVDRRLSGACGSGRGVPDAVPR